MSESRDRDAPPVFWADVVEVLPLPLVVVEPRGRILYENQATRTALDRPQPLVGQHLDEVLPLASGNPWRPLLARVAGGDGAPLAERVARRLPEGRQEVPVTVTPLATRRAVVVLVHARAPALDGSPGRSVLSSATPAPPPGPSGNGPSERPVSPRRRILLVEDQGDVREALFRLLRRWGHDVRAAGDGATALEVAKALQPDVAILDIGLPHLDGWEVARRLRQEVGDDLLLLALTGRSQRADRERSRRVGIDAHLVKPVDPQDLKRRLDRRPMPHASTP